MVEDKDHKEDFEVIDKLLWSIEEVTKLVHQFTFAYKNKMSSMVDVTYGQKVFSTGVFNEMRKLKDLLSTEMIQRLPSIDLNTYVAALATFPKYFVSPSIPTLLPIAYNSCSDVFGPYTNSEMASVAVVDANNAQAEYAKSHPGVPVKTYKIWVLDMEGMREHIDG